MAGHLGRKCTIGRKVLVEETEQLFKGAKWTEEFTGLKVVRLKLKGGRRHDAFLFRCEGRQ
jgi:hypothetical protein